MLPDANRVEVTVGFGYDISKNVNVAATYQLISFSDRNGTIVAKTALTDKVPTFFPANIFAGSYSNSANLFGVNLGLSF